MTTQLVISSVTVGLALFFSYATIVFFWYCDLDEKSKKEEK